jgi:K+-transporting ATPase ATPase B chain
MSGVNTIKDKIRKGAASDIKEFIENLGGNYPKECDDIVSRISKQGGTPLVVCKNQRVLGVIHLKDIIKDGVREKFNDLSKMGIKTIMITGDNPLTAATIVWMIF